MAPLVQDGAASVLPMEAPAPDKPWLLEICPASTLKRLGLYKKPYKGSSPEHAEARRAILAHLEAHTGLVVSDLLRSVLIEDPGGDALDSVVAAVTVARSAQDPDSLRSVPHPSHGVEGHVYT